MKKLIGNKQFYRMVLLIAVPIMIQNGITNFVNMLDNIMIGRVGTEQMAGVSIVNQLFFVFNITIFGAISGPSIFGAQYFGNQNHEGVRQAFRFKLILGAIITGIGLILFSLFGEQLINFYLHDDKEIENIKATLNYGKDYLGVMLIGIIPFVVSQCYSSTLRETGETKIPMLAGIAAIAVNFSLNLILIFGLLGFPELGVVGAAIATVISRFVECAIIVGWTHKYATKNIFIVRAYRSFYISKDLVKQIMIKGTPLLVNEALWAGGMAMLTQRYSTRGLDVIAGLNISSTIVNVFNIVFLALGSSIAIIVGQLLGANKFKEAKETAGKLIFFSVSCCFVIGAIMALFSPIFPEAFETTETAKNLGCKFILISAVLMPLHAFTHASYFTLRSGGKTIVTFLFDSVFVWSICVPTAYFLTEFTALPILPIYLICQSLEIIKCTIGFILVRKGVWINRIIIS